MDAILDCVRYSGTVFMYGGLGGPQVTYSVLKTIYGVSICRKNAKHRDCIQSIVRRLRHMLESRCGAFHRLWVKCTEADMTICGVVRSGEEG